MRAGWIAAACAAVVVLAAGVAWPVLDRAYVGIPGFYVWKSVSGRAHGGARADLDGVRIYYETFGQGPPVLVLHGGTGFLESMHYPIEDLAGDHLVIAPDSRAHGRSTDAAGPLRYDDMASDMIALIDRLHIAKADVVGWSDGGIVALDLAMRFPERIGRVVAIGANYDVAGLIDPNIPPSPDNPTYAPARDFYRLISPTPARWPVFYGKILRMWRTQPHFSLTDLGRIRGPVLVIAGQHDAVRRDHTDALARAIPGAREVIIPGATHMAPLDDPRPVVAAIHAFLERPNATP
jgi:pimeloyl-ACP methyl ester carboxylesterase